MSNENIALKVTPVRMMFPPSEAENKNDFRIYACETESKNVIKNKYGNISIKGVMQRLDFYEEYEVTVRLIEIHPTFGASYEITSAPLQKIPQTPDEQRSFLSTVITPLQIEEIYKVYPDQDIIQMFIDDKFDYTQVHNFGPVVYQRVKEKIMENIGYREILAKLGSYGINYNAIMKLEEMFENRDMIIQKIEENPYYLTKIPGWGFKKADKVARHMGIQGNNPHRIDAGIHYTLKQNEQDGHTFMTKKKLLEASTEILDIEAESIEAQLNKTQEIKIVDGKISTIRAYNAELFIAKEIKRRLDEIEPLEFDPEAFIEKIENTYKGILKKGLTHQQKDFFRMFQKNSVGLLVGYAGTGKSQLQKFLVELLDMLGLTYSFLSPSAKAAKVTKNYTGINAQTMHRKMKYFEDKKDEDMAEIEEDVVIVDEFGMGDAFITAKLFALLSNPNTRVLFVGDDFQLASVGAGSLLYDMIQSEVVPMTKLDIVFRQEEGGLLDIATKIRQKEKFLSNDFEGTKKFGEDFFIHCLDQFYMEEAYQKYYKMFLKSHDAKEIMVLSPTKKAKLGTVAINQFIQDEVNKQDGFKKEHVYGEDKENSFRVDDYVMNTQNMYEVESMLKEERYNEEFDEMETYYKIVDVVNGDTGDIVDIKEKDDILLPGQAHTPETRAGIVINIDGIPVKFGFDTINQILHGWSYTIHKSQGSAAEAVLCIADKSHKRQLTANLIYTALTRTRGKCILITQAETLNYAINQVEGKRRNTNLQEFLAQVFKQ